MAQIPEWYDATTYIGAENLTREQWKWNIFVRLWVRGSIVQGARNIFNLYVAHLKEYGPLCLRNALSPFEECVSLVEGIFNERRTIEPIKDFLLRNARISSEFRENSELPLDRIIDGLPCLGSVALTVNLNSTDEQIITSFKAWLAETRKRKYVPKFDATQSKRRISDSDLKRWSAHRVLAFEDLRLFVVGNSERLGSYDWGGPEQVISKGPFDPELMTPIADSVRRDRELLVERRAALRDFLKPENFPLSHYEMGVALFGDRPDGTNENPAERVRQTVLPLANSIFTDWHIFTAL